MASNQPLTLMDVPLEVRHQIFEHVAKRDTKPEKLLRYWFEKEEVKEKTAELLAKDPSVGQPRIVYEGDQFEAEEREVESEEENMEEDSDEEDDEEDEDEEDEEDEDGEDGEDEDEDEEEELGDEEEENEAEEQDEEMADDDSTTIPATAASAVSANAQGSTAADTASQQAMTQAQHHPAAADQTAVPTSADQSTLALKYDIGEAMIEANAQVMAELGIPPVAATKSDLSAPQTSRQDGVEDEDVDADMAEGGEDDVDAEDGAAEEEDTQMDDEEEEEEEEDNGNEDADGDSDEDMEDEDGDEDTMAGAAQPTSAPVVTAHRKWRHIPKVRVKRR
jgi:hypothetical protein